MKPMPWRFLVLTEAGGDSATPVRVEAAGADGWLRSIGTVLELPAGGAGKVRLELTSPEAFEPAQVSACLAAQVVGGAASGRAAAPPVPSAAELDAILHHPQFRQLESAWRGLGLLLEHAGGVAEVEVLSVARKDLAARLRTSVFERELNRDAPLSLILADFDFSHQPGDLALLGRLAEMAKVLQAPLVAAASAAFFDLRYLVQAVALPDLGARLGGTAHDGWRKFQAGEPARWVALTINRYLQRAPHTPSRGGHAEGVSESNPDSYLWGRSIWLVGAAVARSVGAHGHPLDVAGARGGRFERLPVRAYPTGANTTVPLATEVPLPELQTLELSRSAFTPLVGPLRSDVAILPMAVTAFRLTAGKLTVEGTLAYQLLAARLAQFCGRMLDELPRGAESEITAFLRRELVGFLGSLAGEKPEEAVTVEVRRDEAATDGPTVAEVQVRPAVMLEGKHIEFGFVLPLATV